MSVLLLLSTFLFSVGLVVVWTKKHVLFVLIGVELMVHAASMNFILFSRYDPTQQGQVCVLFIMAMVVCETVVALSLTFKVHQQQQSIALDQLQQLRESAGQ